MSHIDQRLSLTHIVGQAFVVGRHLNLKVVHQAPASHQHLVLIPTGPDSPPRQQFELVAVFQRGTIKSGSFHDRNRQGMLRMHLGPCRQIEDPFLGVALRTRHSLADGGLAVGKSTGLIERQSVQRRHRL